MFFGLSRIKVLKGQLAEAFESHKNAFKTAKLYVRHQIDVESILQSV